MTTRITCPGCDRLLLLPTDCTAKLLSCPRCLAQLENPQAPDRSSAVQAEPPPPSSAVTASQPIAYGRLRRMADVDAQARRDSRGTSAFAIVLTILGGLGIGYALLGSFALLSEGVYQPLLILLGVLTVFTFISVCGVASHNPSETAGANLGRALLGVLRISGIIVGVGGLLVFAAVILIFVVCLANGGKC